jgi:septation ring formation regulator EzrA
LAKEKAARQATK